MLRVQFWSTEPPGRCYDLELWTQVVGSLWQPEILQEAPVALRALVEGPAGRDAATQLLYSPRDRTAVALCSSLIPPERAAAWVEGMLSHVEAQHAVVVASLPVRTCPDRTSLAKPNYTVLVTCCHVNGHSMQQLLPHVLRAPCPANTMTARYDTL